MSITNFPTGADVFPVRLSGSGIVYTPSSTTVTIAAADAARLVAQLAANSAPAVSATNPFQFTMFRAAYYNGTFQDPTKVANYTATGVNTSTGVLSGVVYVGGSGPDQSFSGGDYLASTVQFRTILLHSRAINAVETNKLDIVGGDASQTVVTASGASTPRSLAVRAADVVNVKDRGAVGDGAHDDTSAIQDAFDVVAAKGRVVFPLGRYKTTFGLTIDKDVTIEGVYGTTLVADVFGAGQWVPGAIHGVSIEAYQSSGAVLTVHKDLQVLAVTIDKIGILGLGGGTATGLAVQDVVRSNFSNITICNFYTGFHAVNLEEGSGFNCHFIGCETGTLFDTPSNANHFINFNYATCGVACIVDASTQLEFTGGTVQGCVTSGFVIRNSSNNVTITNIYFENVAVTGFSIDSNSYGTKLDMVHFTAADDLSSPGDKVRATGGATHIHSSQYCCPLRMYGPGNVVLGRWQHPVVDLDANAIAQTIWLDFQHEFRPATNVRLEAGNFLQLHSAGDVQKIGRDASNGDTIIGLAAKLRLLDSVGSTFYTADAAGGYNATVPAGGTNRVLAAASDAIGVANSHLVQSVSSPSADWYGWRIDGGGNACYDFLGPSGTASAANLLRFVWSTSTAAFVGGLEATGLILSGATAASAFKTRILGGRAVPVVDADGGTNVVVFDAYGIAVNGSTRPALLGGAAITATPVDASYPAGVFNGKVNVAGDVTIPNSSAYNSKLANGTAVSLAVIDNGNNTFYGTFSGDTYERIGNYWRVINSSFADVFLVDVVNGCANLNRNDDVATLGIRSGAYYRPVLYVQGATAQAEPLVDIRNSVGAQLTTVDASGNLVVRGDRGISSAIVAGISTPQIYVQNYNDGEVPVVVQGTLTQSAPLQQWKNGVGSVIASVSSDGSISTASNLIVSGTATYIRNNSGSVYFGASDDSRLYRIAASYLGTPGSLSVGSSASAGVGLAVTSSNSGHVGAIVQGAPSQLSDLHQWKDSVGSPMAGVTFNGIIYSGVASGDFGVGIECGAANAAIQAKGSGNPQLRVTSTGGVTTKVQAVGGSFGLVGTESNHPFKIYVNQSPVVYIDTTGYVCVGNAVPGEKLDVYDSTLTNLKVRIRNNKTDSTSNTAELVFAARSGGDLFDRAKILANSSNTGNYRTEMDFQTIDAGTGVWTSRMLIDSDGNAGFSRAIKLAAITDAEAPNGSYFKGSDHSNKACFKDDAGVVHELY